MASNNYDFYQTVFTKDYKNDSFYFQPNGPCLPNNKDIDEMIRILEELKDKEVKKKWERYFEKVEKEISEKSKRREKEILEKSGYIYLLKSRNLYKIGRTLTIKSRMKSYRAENPFGIKVIIQRKVNDYIKTETMLLKMFKGKQVRGEWFKLKEDDIRKIKDLLQSK